MQARAGSFDEPSAQLFRCVRCSDVRVIGYGARFRMMRDEEYNAEDMDGEWRHTFSLYGATNFTIQGLRIENSGGDAIYISESDEVPSRDVSIVDVTVDGARRQGISVISVDGLTVREFACRDVRGRYPMAAIDFEPNHDHQVLKRITMDGLRFENNGRTGIFFALSNLDFGSDPVDIDIRNVYLKDNWIESAHYASNKSRAEIIMSTGVPGSIAFTNVYVDGSQQGLLYNRSDADGLSVSFTNVVARDLNTRSDSWLPIGLEVRDYSVDPLPMGNIHFDDVWIESAKSPLMQIRGSGSSTNELRDLTGTINYVGNYETLLNLIDLDGESNHTLEFVEASSLPSEEEILGSP